MNSDFPAYATSEEHELLRQTVRELAEAKIAPAAATPTRRYRTGRSCLTLGRNLSRLRHGPGQGRIFLAVERIDVVTVT